MTVASVEQLQAYLVDQLQNVPIVSKVEEFAQNGLSTAGRRHEEIFTREFLCPAVANFFCQDAAAGLNLTKAEIRSGLGNSTASRTTVK